MEEEILYPYGRVRGFVVWLDVQRLEAFWKLVSMSGFEIELLRAGGDPWPSVASSSQGIKVRGAL